MVELEKLKKLILQSEDLNEPFDYFFDLMEANKISSIPGHHQLGPELEAGLKSIIRIIELTGNYKLCSSIEDLIPLFYRVPSCHFIHGNYLSKTHHPPIAMIFFWISEPELLQWLNRKSNYVVFQLCIF